MQNLKLVLGLMGKDLEKTKEGLIKNLGNTDPGHDIGDADTALEILSNQITEQHDDYTREDFCKAYSLTFRKPNTMIPGMEMALIELEKLSTEQWQELHKELYPETQPYSGFGPAW